ncbi:MAG: molybdopterin-dependent oxidoreductase, partial [Acidobacteria bacterium]|nr:molybdopterin-dependent oxidoreductase [Acidobacteriota bacterium]
MSETHYRTCPLCEAMCGLEIRLEDERLTSIRGDADDPFSRGHICPKAVALQDIQTDPDRLRAPLLRSGDGWRTVGWDEAFDLAARRLREVQAAHGRDAVAVYQGNPTVHNVGTLLYAPGFVRALGTKNRFSATSVDQLPHHVAARFMFGHMLLLPIPDVDRTDFFLILGANPAASNGSLMTAPGIKERIKAIRQRGGKVVVLDPRRTETAQLADRHIPIRPGTDALFLAALVRQVLADGAAESGPFADRLAAFSDSVETLRAAVEPFAADRVAAATGLGTDTIRELADDLRTAPSSACYGRMGLSTQGFGSVCQWLINALNAVTGNLDRPGGVLFPRPAVDLVAFTSAGGSDRWRSRVRGLPEFGGELPVAALAEDIDTPGEGRIRALVTSAGNPVLSTPNGRRLEAALGGLDFILSIDFYLNETTRHAHLILPPTAPLEHDHYDLAFHGLAIRNTAKFSPALFEPDAACRHDWQIFHELHRRLARRKGLGARLERWIRGRFGPRLLLDLGLRRGPWGSALNPFSRGLTLGRLRRRPHGIDLGPLEPSLPGRLRTRGGRIDLAPERFVADLARLAASLDGAVPELVLIGRRQVRSCNSWMHNYPRLMKGRDRCTLLMNPADAAR